MIRPCIVYADHCDEALEFYVSIFPNSKVLSIQRAEADNGPVTKGQVLGATFQLDGREYLAFDGGPTFKFTEGFSLMVNCKTQEEVDRYWTKLTQGGGEEGPCGWLKDKYGLSWQVVPTALMELLNDPDRAKAQRVMSAMLQMGKIEIEPLRRAYEGEEQRAATT